ncbi:MAG TPA: hypothetical protein VFE33_25780 [Thermoanaerobaculia bacterium]|nr:hypothetical protein [Thermoanaerobaculia bacterium]
MDQCRARARPPHPTVLLRPACALYPWTRPETLIHDPVVAAKSASPGWRSSSPLWSLFALLLRRTSLAQDRAGGEHRRVVRLFGAAAFRNKFWDSLRNGLIGFRCVLPPRAEP